MFLCLCVVKYFLKIASDQKGQNVQNSDDNDN